MQDKSQVIPYEIAHATTGRIRLRVPYLKSSQDFADRLQHILASHASVTEVRLNAAASSMIITYRPKIISEDAIQEQIHRDIQQAGGIPSAVTPEVRPAPEAEPAPEKLDPVDSAEAADQSPSPEQFVSESSVIEQSAPQQSADHSSVSEPIVLEPALPLQSELLDSEPLPNQVTASEEPQNASEASENTSEAEPILLVSETESETESETALEKALKTESEKSERCSEVSVTSPATSPTAPVSQQPAVQPELASDQGMKLSQRMLAKRLHVSSSSLRQQRTQPNFLVWSAAKDPEGKGWRYNAQSGCFYPAIPDQMAQ